MKVWDKRAIISFLVVLLAAVVSLQALNIGEAEAFQYRIFGQYNENGTEYSKIENDYTFVQFDSAVPDYVWGNVKITYDNPDKVECVSIEESFDYWGFWNWWTTETANPANGGGGIPYYYSDGGGQWAEQWVNSGYGYGVPGSIDEPNGTVYFYTSTYAGDPAYTRPLRLGLRLKNGVNGPVNVTFSVSYNNSTDYDWFDGNLSYPEHYQVIIMPEFETVSAVVDIHPDTLNLKSKGRYITAYIEIPDHDMLGVDISSVRLNDTIPAELKPTSVGDYDKDGIPDLMVKFDRASLSNIPAGAATLKITGTVAGTPFAGEKTIRAIK